ncbi:MAG: hypothetical protein ACLVC7_04985 [Monoglobus pectinilyticus]
MSGKFQARFIGCRKQAAAMEIADDLRFFSGAEVLYYGNSDILFYDVDVKTMRYRSKDLRCSTICSETKAGEPML